jgi:hypothetical protein
VVGQQRAKELNKEPAYQGKKTGRYCQTFIRKVQKTVNNTGPAVTQYRALKIK